MTFSILIPTFKNLEYLELTINSLKKNSTYEHEIIVHNNANDKKTEFFLKKNSILFTFSQENIGLCSAVNTAYKKSSKNFIVYAHDDMYFLPEWDLALSDEIKKLDNNLFFFSSTQIGPQNKLKNEVDNHIFFNAGENISNFKERYLLDNYKNLKFHDMQGSHWAPHIIHRDIWEGVGGFSEEFNPGFVSDPDLNMKLWKKNVRIFKGVNKSRVYHFGSLTTRKRDLIKKNNGKKVFLLKWGISVEHFIRHYLNRGDLYNGSLVLNKNFKFYTSLIISKLKYFIYYIIN